MSYSFHSKIHCRKIGKLHREDCFSFSLVDGDGSINSVPNSLQQDIGQEL